MALTITEPIKQVNGLLTKAIAARSQVLYEMQREDTQVIAVTYLAPYTAIKVNIADAGKFTIGDNIYLGVDWPDFDAGLYIITNITGADLNYLSLDSAQRTGGETPRTGYVNNLTTKPNYRIAIDIYKADATKMYQRTFRYVPNQAGFVSVDLKTLLSNYLSENLFSVEYYLEVTEEWTGKIDPPDYTANFPASVDNGGLLQLNALSTSTAILSAGAEIFVTFSATYESKVYTISSIVSDTSIVINTPFIEGSAGGNVFPAVNVPTTTLQAVYAQRQLLTQGGANMWQNLLRETNKVWYASGFDAVQDTGGKVTLTINSADVTDNFRVGGIVDCDFTGVYTDGQYIIQGLNYDNTNTNILTDIDYISPASCSSRAVYSAATLLTRFANPVMWRGWNRTAGFLMDSEFINRTGFANNNVLLRTESYNVNKVYNGVATNNETLINPANSVYVQAIDQTYNDTSYYYRVYVRQGGDATPLNEPLFYKLRNECPQAIMLDWINSEGGVDQWLFSINQTGETITGEGVLAERPITTDIESVTRTKQRFPGASKQRLTLSAEHLTGDQLGALSEIKKTNSLRVYLSKDGTSFIDAVVVNDFTTTFQTKDKRYSFSVQIEFPDDFNFFSGKLY